MDKTENSKFNRMTTRPIPGLICTLAVPTIISMLVTALYNIADTFFVGQVGTEATAGVGLVFPVMAIIQAFGFFCGQGSGNYLSRLLGGGKKTEANEVAITGFLMALLIGLLIAGLGNLEAERIADWIGATDSSRADTVAYLRIILMGAPFMTCQFVINNQLRFQGSAMVAMIGLMCGAVINIILDPVLIFGFGLGIRGAALATVAGQGISFAALLIGSSRGENIHLSLSNARWNPGYILQIANGGLPSLVRQGLAAVSTLLLNNAARTWGGDPAIAGMSVTSRALMLLVSALIGFGQGYQPVCSYNYGAGLYGRVKEGFRFCVKYGTILMTAAGAICLLWAAPIVRFFRNDPEVVAVGSVALRWQAAVLPLLAFSILTNMMLQATGKGIKSSITSSARNGIFFIPLILTLPRFFGLLGVEMTQAWADILTFLLCVPIARAELRKMDENRPAGK